MPHIQLAQARRRLDLMTVLALWHELVAEWRPEEPAPLRATLRRRHAKESLSRYLRSSEWLENPRYAERACGFDIILRLVSGQIDTMHATNAFFTHADNAQWFEPVDMAEKNASVRGVNLTPAARATWENASEQERRQALGEARRLLESDIESEGVTVALLPVRAMPAPSAQPAAAVRPAAPASRQDYLEALAHDIQHAPFQSFYRRKPFGSPVTGWDERLKAYFWPRPEQGYAATSCAMQAIGADARRLANALAHHGGWTAQEQREAVELAHAIFAWGGVPQDEATVTPHTVQQVFQAAIGDDGAAAAPMNSGWTKVAAFATAHAEDDAAGLTHAIWDSRVAASITARLDMLLPADTDPGTLFPGVGSVPGRGGSRPRKLSRTWPSGYRSWSGHVAGSRTVRELRDVLNKGAYPKMPLPDGGSGRWTTRGVEMVLFMDGY